MLYKFVGFVIVSAYSGKFFSSISVEWNCDDLSVQDEWLLYKEKLRSDIPNPGIFLMLSLETLQLARAFSVLLPVSTCLLIATMCNYNDARMNLRVWACCPGMCRTHDTMTVCNCQDTLSEIEVKIVIFNLFNQIWKMFIWSKVMHLL